MPKMSNILKIIVKINSEVIVVDMDEIRLQHKILHTKLS